MASDTKKLEELASSIKRRKFSNDFVPNIICIYDDKLIVWNDDDQSLYLCTLDDQQQIRKIQVIALSCPPLFSVISLSLNPHGNYLALSGASGLMVVELPRNWHASRHESSEASLVRSVSIGERMFLCNQNLKLLCLHWHPLSPKHLLILTNDDCLRLFDIENEYEPIITISLGCKSSRDSHYYSISQYSASFGETAVAFDFGISLANFFHTQANVNELADIFPVFVLRGNGDVCMLYLSLKDLAIAKQIHGPLKMTPAAEDNYGVESCSILCLESVPPVVVIGTNAGLLHHCVALVCEYDENEQGKLEEVCTLTTSTGLQISMPEVALHVFETIELSFPLANNQMTSHDEPYSPTDSPDSVNSLQLISDSRDPKRYFCTHLSGVHIVNVTFLNQLFKSISNGFYDEKSLVEYFICTRPTIENNQTVEQSNLSFPIGISLVIHNGFSYLSVLLNSAELISKRLSNALPNIDLAFDKIQKDQKTASYSVLSNKDNGAEQTVSQKPSFTDHLEKILSKSTSLPLIKASKLKDAPVGVVELEILLNSIDLLKKEYLAKLTSAANTIQKRKNVLKDDCNVQMGEIDLLKKEKDSLLQKYVTLVSKYDQVRDMQNEISARLEQRVASIQNQSAALSDAELALKEELTKEKNKLASYQERFEQIKQKQRYQELQLRKEATLDDSSEDCSEITSQLKIKNIKERLAYQGTQISELISILNLVKTDAH